MFMDRADFQKRAISIFTERKYCFSNFEESSRDRAKEWKTETAKLGSLCDFVRVTMQGVGSVHLVLFIYGDDLSGEAIIGKCRLISDALAVFKQFALRFCWSKQPVIANVFFIFENSDNAFNFRKSVQDHCKHFGFMNTKWVLPYGVDMSAKSVFGYKGLPAYAFKLAEIEARLFS